MTPQQRLARFRALLANRPAPDAPSDERAIWLTEAVSVFHAIDDVEIAARRLDESRASSDVELIRFLEAADPETMLAARLGVVPIATGASARMRSEAEAAYARQAELLAAEAREIEADRQASLERAEEAAYFEQQLAAAVAAQRAARVAESRATLIAVHAEDRDRKVEALCALLEGRTGGYRSLPAAFIDVTGRTPTNPADWKRAHAGYDSGQERAHESVTTATWAQVMGDSVTRRVVDEYNTSPGSQAWRYLTSEIITDADFRTQRFTRLGGYGTLPTVAQGAPFQPLPTPTDEAATTTIAKRGGVERFTFEAFNNGELGEVRRAIAMLARAGANTLNRAVLDTLTTNPVTGYDGVAMFHASHGNTAASTLSGGTLAAARSAMRKQASLADPADVIGAVPRYLIVPTELEELAWQLCATPGAALSDDAIDGPRSLYEPVTPIVAGHWTSTTAWHLVANPRSVPTFGVAFYGSSQDPAVIIGPDPNTDAVWIKIRHAWGIAVLDHRGFQRGNV